MAVATQERATRTLYLVDGLPAAMQEVAEMVKRLSQQDVGHSYDLDFETEDPRPHDPSWAARSQINHPISRHSHPHLPKPHQPVPTSRPPKA
ncbi:hypothetical protein CYY_009336 [Polysphondylium violaceum]|uniref:Uncharacterized protein n=1 Tax=Polysphondylium violaceum TaxID=133409 RepID=A0A8J4UW52_9MYCE|nr:hypothetical protein CYY_009336 [Polysphondylium violaceum]